MWYFPRLVFKLYILALLPKEIFQFYFHFSCDGFICSAPLSNSNNILELKRNSSHTWIWEGHRSSPIFVGIVSSSVSINGIWFYSKDIILGKVFQAIDRFSFSTQFINLWSCYTTLQTIYWIISNKRWNVL